LLRAEQSDLDRADGDTRLGYRRLQLACPDAVQRERSAAVHR